MKCPFCRENTSEVYNTRSTKLKNQIWRRRRCQKCNQSFTTYEQPDLSYLKVTSDTKKSLPYSRAKLFSSIYAAFEGINSEAKTIDAVTDTVEARILDLKKPMVSREDIATTVLTTLKHFNTPAFLKYLATHAAISGSQELKRQLKQY